MTRHIFVVQTDVTQVTVGRRLGRTVPQGN